MLPAGRNLRHLECWLWIFFWFTSLLGLFLWKSSVGKGLIWGLQFSLYCVSLCLSHIWEKQRAVTPVLLSGAWWRLPGKSAECRVWAESGCCSCRRRDREVSRCSSYPWRREKYVWMDLEACTEGRVPSAGGHLFSLLKNLLHSFTEGEQKSYIPQQTTLLLSKCFVFTSFSTTQFEYQTQRSVSEEEKVASKGFATRISP